MVRYAPLAALAVAPQLAFGRCVRSASLTTSSSPVASVPASTVIAAANTLKATSTSVAVSEAATTKATQAQTTSTSSTETVQPSSSSASSAGAAASSSASSSASASSGTSSILSSTAITGTSTFYGGNLSGGSCSFTTMSELPSGIYGTAFSGADWDDAASCGACLQVTGPNGNSIKVMVVDECPECETGHLDLFEDAFAELGATSAGKIATSYVPVSCGLSDPLTLHAKSGASAYWFSMQVVGHNEPVAGLEVSADGGATWTAAARQSYNYFENASGFGSGAVDVRVTSATGDSLVVSGVTVSSDAVVSASGNI